MATISSRALLALLVAVASSVVLGAELQTLYQWNYLSWALPKDFSGRDGYTPENAVFTGLEVGWRRLFVSVPRLRPGVPATLSWIPRDAAPGSSPQLQAYPDWSWHSPASNCSGLISVYRVRADRCDRLWVLDSGLYDSLGSYTPLCPPKLLTFDLRTDRLLRSIEFPSDVRRLNSLFTNLVLDETPGGDCDDIVVYISDTAAPGMVVYDVKKGSTWRFGHAAFWPHPDWSTYEVAGERFTLMDGLVGMALTPAPATPQHPLQTVDVAPVPASRTMFFQPLANDRLYSVPTAALRAGPLPEGEELPITLVGHKSSQSANLAIDQRDGTVYFCPVRETALAAYSPATQTTRVITYDPEKLQFSSELVIAPRDHLRFWLTSSRFQKYFRRTWRAEEVNMRVMMLTDGPSAAAPGPRLAAPAFAPAATAPGGFAPSVLEAQALGAANQLPFAAPAPAAGPASPPATGPVFGAPAFGIHPGFRVINDTAAFPFFGF